MLKSIILIILLLSSTFFLVHLLHGSSFDEAAFLAFHDDPDALPSHGDLSTLKRAVKFDRFILVVVDGLPAAQGLTAFPFLSRLVSQGSAVSSAVLTQSPTVTLPRLTAMLTGRPPSFSSALLNFNAAALPLRSTFLAPFFRGASSPLVFYGDDTWLRLFPEPGCFLRREGVSSFFVTDAHTVDANVTRNVLHHRDLPDAHPDNRWAGMLLHYLGIDHLGHRDGTAASPALPAKQQEMDAVFELLWRRFVAPADAPRTLLLVASDHGMTAAGSHGGATEEERNAFLFAAARDWSQTGTTQERSASSAPVLHQEDIAATLPLLFDLPPPPGAIGVPILSWIHAHLHTPAFALDHQSIQMLLLEYFTLSFHRLQSIHYFLGLGSLAMPTFSSSHPSTDESSWVALRRVQEVLYGALAGASDNTLCMIGISLSVLAAVIVGYHWTLMLRSLAGTLTNIQRFQISCLIFFMLFIPICTFASSFVEEEHELWYFFLTTWLVMQLIIQYTSNDNSSSRSPSTLLLLLVCVLISKRFHQTGVKWRHLPDLSDRLTESAPTWLLVGLIMLSIFAPAVHISSTVSRLQRTLLRINALFVLASQLLRFLTGLNIPLPIELIVHRLPYGIFSISILACFFHSSNSISFWILMILQMLQFFQRWQNTFLYLIFILMIYLLTRQSSFSSSSSSASPSSFQIIIDTSNGWFVGMASFFMLGNSNSLSTIDFSGAFVGLGEFSQILIGGLTFVVLFGGPILFFLAQALCSPKPNREFLSFFVLTHLSLDVLFSQLSFYHFQNHLFVWSVFAPKLLYSSFKLLFGFVFIIFMFILEKLKK